MASKGNGIKSIATLGTDLKSTCLSHAEYDMEASVMTLTFKSNGYVYTYDGVSPETYEELVHDKAPGRYFVYNVRNAGYPYKRVA